jgi:ribosomal protein S18 acetylase RimI-like enzyme
VRRLTAEDLALIAELDRSEHVDVEYTVMEGRLQERPVSMAEIPSWDQEGCGEHSVAAKAAHCADLLATGAVLLGAFDGDALMGLTIIHPSFEPGLGWLAFLHVSRPHRRRGAARELWRAAAEVAREAGARSLYVSATPTGSAVGFYLGQGCRLARPVHPTLFAEEPDDIHLVCPLT